VVTVVERQVTAGMLLRAVAWPIAVVPIVAPRIAERPIVVELPIVAGIIPIAELRSAQQQWEPRQSAPPPTATAAAAIVTPTAPGSAHNQ
jgi:hypothetical protein